MRILFFFQKRKFGEILEPAKIWGQKPQIYLGFLSMYNRLNCRHSLIDSQLRALISVKVSQINDCPFCIDMNAQLLFERGGSTSKLNELSDYQQSSLFTGKEKASISYAEAMTLDKCLVDEMLFNRLKEFYNDDEIIELTALIAFQNMSSRFNAALKIPSQEICKINHLDK